MAEIEMYARELGLAEEEFSVELAEELAWAITHELREFGKATLADKVIAFILGLAAESVYSRAVLELAERGEGARAMALAPSTTYDKYYKESKREAKDKAIAGEGPFRAVLVKLLVSLAAFDLEDLRIVPKISASSVEELLKLEKGELEVMARVRTGERVKEVKGEVVWKKTDEGGLTVHIRGELLGFLKREDFVRGVDRYGVANDGVVGGWLATDASVVENKVKADTTSLFQAALYKASGFEDVKAEDWGTATGAGFKVYYHGSSSGLYQRCLKIANGVRAGLGVVQPLGGELKEVEGNLEKLAKAKEAVKTLVDKLLAEGRISVHPAAGLSVKEAAERVKKAVDEILSPKAAERIDPVEHSAYGRIYYPLTHLLINDVSEVELAQFFTTVILGDGTVNHYYAELALGEFGAGKLPYDRFHKLALWLAVLEKYRPLFEKHGADITPSVYIVRNIIRLRLDLKAAGLLFALGGGPIWRVYDEYVGEVGRNMWDRGFIKAEEMLETVKEIFKDVKVKWHIDEAGERPVLRIRFVKNVGGEEVEVANLNVYVEDTPTGKRLYALFAGARERAEALASILRAWGAEAEAKPVGKEWYVRLTTGQLSAVDHPELKRALEVFVAKAKEKGLLTEEQAERKVAKVRAGPNAVEIAGVEFNVDPVWRGKGTSRRIKTVHIFYQPTGRDQFERAVKALEALGLVRDVHFTAEWDDKGMGDIWLRPGALEKAVEALKAAGFNEGKDITVKKARGGGGRIHVNNPKKNLKKALEALEGAGLERGKDYTVYGSRGYIRLAMPVGLWTIAYRAKGGDNRAKEVLDRLLRAAERLGIRQYFEERMRPVMLAGTKNAVGKKVSVEGVALEIVDFKVEWVSFEDANKPCYWPAELCRPKVIVKYKAGNEESTLTVMWGINKGLIRADVWMSTLDKAAALIAVAVWEGDEEERKRIIEAAKRGGKVALTLDNLLAMAQYDESLMEWVMRIKKALRS